MMADTRLDVGAVAFTKTGIDLRSDDQTVGQMRIGRAIGVENADRNVRGDIEDAA